MLRIASLRDLAHRFSAIRLAPERGCYLSHAGPLLITFVEPDVPLRYAMAMRIHRSFWAFRLELVASNLQGLLLPLGVKPLRLYLPLQTSLARTLATYAACRALLLRTLPVWSVSAGA